MAGLVDIAPAAETVAIRGTQIAVTGVSAHGIAMLLARFPDLRRMLSGLDVDADSLIGMGGEVVAAILAAGTGAAGDEAAEAAAAGLSVDEQIDLLSAIMRVTMPKGVGPLAEKLAAMGLVLDGGAASGSAPATKSRKRSKS